MLDNLKTQKDMGKVHTSTQMEVTGQVSGDGGKRPKMVLMKKILLQNFFKSINTSNDAPTKLVLS